MISRIFKQKNSFGQCIMNLQPATCNLQPATCNLQPATISQFSLLPSKEVIQSVQPAANSQTNNCSSIKSSAHQTESSIRVSIEKVDQLINLAGEWVITQVVLAQSAIEAISEGNEHLQHGLYQCDRNPRDLQGTVMSIRIL